MPAALASNCNPARCQGMTLTLEYDTHLQDLQHRLHDTEVALSTARTEANTARSERLAAENHLRSVNSRISDLQTHGHQLQQKLDRDAVECSALRDSNAAHLAELRSKSEALQVSPVGWRRLRDWPLTLMWPRWPRATSSANHSFSSPPWLSFVHDC